MNRERMVEHNSTKYKIKVAKGFYICQFIDYSSQHPQHVCIPFAYFDIHKLKYLKQQMHNKKINKLFEQGKFCNWSLHHLTYRATYSIIIPCTDRENSFKCLAITDSERIWTSLSTALLSVFFKWQIKCKCKQIKERYKSSPPCPRMTLVFFVQKLQ